MFWEGLRPSPTLKKDSVVETFVIVPPLDLEDLTQDSLTFHISAMA